MSVINKNDNVGFCEINYEKVKQYRINEGRACKSSFVIILSGFALIIALGFPSLRIITLLSILLLFAGSHIFTSKAKEAKEYWDGVVINKKIETKIEYKKKGYEERKIYMIEVKKDNGKLIKFKFNEREDIYNYYKIGDIIRHHKGFDLFERYNKNRSNYILCLACLKMNSKNREYCKQCDCKLFK